MTNVAFLLLSLTVCTIHGAVGNNLCRWSQHLHCNGLHLEICGNDGTTYWNSCAFAKAQCSNPKLQMSHHGACRHVTTASTPTTKGEELVLSIICDDVTIVDCSKHGSDSQYCGSDGTTYRNMCFFEKAKCQNKQLHVKAIGPCRK